jgi:hypothetical protein
LDVLTCFRQEVTIIYALAPHINIVRMLGYAESPTNDLVLVEELCDTNLKTVIHSKVTILHLGSSSNDGDGLIMEMI